MSRKPPAGQKRYLPFVIIAGALVAVVAAAAWMMRSDSPETSGPSNAGVSSAPVRQRELPGAQPPHTVGSPGAKVVLEEFRDFQCPPCASLHPVLQKIESEYGDRVRIIYRNFPLQHMHKNAFSAARAAEAAGLQGHFLEMQDIIFDNQAEWKDSSEPRPIFQSYASRLGLDMEKFKADMERPEVGARVKADYDRGLSVGVKGTPTVLLNGRELSADKTLSEPKLRAEIDAALAAQGR